MSDEADHPLLASLRQYVRRPGVQRALDSRYGSPTASKARVEELFALIVGALGWMGAPAKDLEREGKDMFVGFLIGDHVGLHTDDLEGRRSTEGINTRQALCLWLASRQPQSVGLSGLWRSWETQLPHQPPLPDSIRAIVHPPAVEGGEQAYLDAAHLMLMAFVVNPGLGALLPVGVPEAHRRLATILLELSGDRMPRQEPERTLCSLLARSFGVSESLASGELIAGIRRAAAQASVRHQLMPADAATMLTWIVGTCVKRKDGTLAAPDRVLEHEVRHTIKKNNVHVYLLRAHNTLRDRIVSRLLGATQNGGAEDAGT